MEPLICDPSVLQPPLIRDYFSDTNSFFLYILPLFYGKIKVRNKRLILWKKFLHWRIQGPRGTPISIFMHFSIWSIFGKGRPHLDPPPFGISCIRHWCTNQKGNQWNVKMFASNLRYSEWFGKKLRFSPWKHCVIRTATTYVFSSTCIKNIVKWHALCLVI